MLIEDLPKTTAVFTTKNIVLNHFPILRVTVDLDGDLQFTSDEKISIQDAMIISLEQILQHDITLKNLPNLGAGKTAYRNSIEQEWILL
jgi:hypothetical protein